MATLIKFHHWDGGMGTSDYETLIGYCKEHPHEVLKYVMNTHIVYYYKKLYRPIDDSYPNNVYGLCIYEFDECKHLQNGLVMNVIGSVRNLDLSEAKLKERRPDTNLLSGMAELRRRYKPYEDTEGLKEYRITQIEQCHEVFDIVNEYLRGEK